MSKYINKFNSLLVIPAKAGTRGPGSSDAVEGFILALQVLEKAHDQLFREGTMDADRSSDMNDHPMFPREESPNFP
jgi:hypothetical protein